jgi:energy-coupling factor transporter transmembrane protein EcfT
MPLEQIIAIVVFVLVLVFIWGIFKKLFKIMFYAGLIIFLLLAANLFFIYQDFTDLKKNFGVSEKKIILIDEDKVLIGLMLNEDTDLMTNEQLNDYSSYLKNNNYEKILGDGYKLMVFDVEIISNLDTELELGDKTITSDEAILILKSDIISLQEKASLFSIILADEILSSRNPLFFFSEFKNGNVIIYPETALFKTIKIIPLSLIKNIGEKIFEKTKEKAKTFVVEESENI